MKKTSNLLICEDRKNFHVETEKSQSNTATNFKEKTPQSIEKLFFLDRRASRLASSMIL